MSVYQIYQGNRTGEGFAYFRWHELCYDSIPEGHDCYVCRMVWQMRKFR